MNKNEITNTRFLRYMESINEENPDNVKGYEFICWISSKWSEFCKMFSRDREHHTKQDGIDFDNWLLESKII